MTGSLDVTPKTTRQNLIVCIGKSEAEINRLCSTYCTVEANADRHEASRGLSATAQPFVLPLATAAPKIDYRYPSDRLFLRERNILG